MPARLRPHIPINGQSAPGSRRPALTLALLLLPLPQLTSASSPVRTGVPADPVGEVRWFEGHDGPVLDVTFLPDGRRALTAGGSDSTAQVWDVASGKELRRLMDSG